jgi:hypothetical protein
LAQNLENKTAECKRHKLHRLWLTAARPVGSALSDKRKAPVGRGCSFVFSIFNSSLAGCENSTTIVAKKLALIGIELQDFLLQGA